MEFPCTPPILPPFSHAVNAASLYAKRLHSALAFAIAPNVLLFFLFLRFATQLPASFMPIWQTFPLAVHHPRRMFVDICCLFSSEYAFSCLSFGHFFVFLSVVLGGTVWGVTCSLQPTAANRFQFWKAVVSPQSCSHFQGESVRIKTPIHNVLPPFLFSLIHQPSMSYTRVHCAGNLDNGDPCSASWDIKKVKTKVLLPASPCLSTSLWQAKKFRGEWWCYSCNSARVRAHSALHSSARVPAAVIQAAQAAAFAACEAAAESSAQASHAALQVMCTVDVLNGGRAEP